jgi:catechol 2,3-dioxygenase-like lactoylglutathione lyase family enzyme
MNRSTIMLGDNDAIATIAVKDLKAARKFYLETLGLKQGPGQEEDVLTCTSGRSRVLVYRSQFAGTNQATAATWAVDDVEGIVRDLKAKGVAFEHYDFPGTTLKGDVHVSGANRVAWFKDPDGNILAVVNR